MLIPIILNGGAGKRLWPLSTPERPKQFHKLFGSKSTFQQTLLRCTGKPFHKKPIIVGSDKHHLLIDQDLTEMGMEADVLLEPVGRDTCAAITIGCLHALRRENDPIVLITPSDHLIEDSKAFSSSVSSAMSLAKAKRLITFGVKPTKASTQYGYLMPGVKLEADVKPAGFELSRFVEKPGKQDAAKFVEQGYLWNSGMFLFKANSFLEEVREHQPEIYMAAEGAFLASSQTGNSVLLDQHALEFCPSISVDFALFEKTKRSVVLPVDFAWRDIGNWEELRDIVDPNLIAEKTFDSSAIDNFQERPWGSYRKLGLGSSHHVKEIRVEPRQVLSLQKHRHRAEHWIIVSGHGEVQIDNKIRAIEKNDSVFIPQHRVHRLRNTGVKPLILIEVQIGDYFGEDDIVRLEDIYDREEKI